MRDVCSLIWLALIGLFRSRASLQVEILTLRHQLNVLRRRSPQRVTFTSIDRLVFAGLYRLAPGVLDALKIVGPETVASQAVAAIEIIKGWFKRVIEPTTGSIRFAGEEITAPDGRQLRNTRRAMQMVYQDPTAALNPRLNSRRTIEEPLRLYFKMTPAERRERLNAVIAEVGLGTDLVERYPRELSDGQRQRVNIPRAIAATLKSGHWLAA
jgi:ABC-type uncharacterized transport system YnjBCD ATPase subunit